MDSLLGPIHISSATFLVFYICLFALSNRSQAWGDLLLSSQEPSFVAAHLHGVRSPVRVLCAACFWLAAFVGLRKIYFFLMILFIYSWNTHTQRERERERGRDPGRGRSRLHAGSPMWDLIPDPRIMPCKGRRSTAEPPRHPRTICSITVFLRAFLKSWFLKS